MECGKFSVACEEEWQGANQRAESSPGRASDAAKQAACRLLGRLKCPAFSALELHNGFPNTVKARQTRSPPTATPGAILHKQPEEVANGKAVLSVNMHLLWHVHATDSYEGCITPEDLKLAFATSRVSAEAPGGQCAAATGADSSTEWNSKEGNHPFQAWRSCAAGC